MVEFTDWAFDQSLHAFHYRQIDIEGGDASKVFFRVKNLLGGNGRMLEDSCEAVLTEPFKDGLLRTLRPHHRGTSSVAWK